MKVKRTRKKKHSRKKQITVAVSGGFDPLHSGHVRLFNAAKQLGDRLVVILNNDHWLKKKKGFFFMPQHERKEIIEALSHVDKVILSEHSAKTDDMSVVGELEKIKPDIFANGGDRTRRNTPEVAFCKETGCVMKFNIGRGGKIQSSSALLRLFRSRSSKTSTKQKSAEKKRRANAKKSSAKSHGRRSRKGRKK